MQNQEISLPWAFLFVIFSHNRIAITSAQQTILRRELKRLKIKVNDISDYQEMIQALKLKVRYNYLANVQDRKQELLASAKIAQSEQLFDQQLSYLKELNRLFPKDSHVRQDLHSRQVGDAEKVLARAKRQHRKTVRRNHAEYTNELPLIKQLFAQAQSFLATRPEALVDLAIMFRQMGHSRVALQILEDQPITRRTAWLMFDFLFHAEQFLALLHHCEIMKVEFADQPMALFAISYTEALTYWELGERERAIELMSHIANMKPNFRSANELLEAWQEESG